MRNKFVVLLLLCLSFSSVGMYGAETTTSNCDTVAENQASDIIEVGGNCSEEDYKKVAASVSKAAERGDAESQLLLANLYTKGIGVEVNHELARKWFRKAAEQGMDVAQYVMGNLYAKGIGVELDYEQAVMWFRKAAMQGNAPAQYNLGYCYEYGLGVDANLTMSEKWYTLANGGSSCYIDEGVEIDDTSSDIVALYREAAERGDVSAQYRLGRSYSMGEGVEQDYDKALKWILKAAKQGYTDAECCLGVFYYTGEAIEQDKAESHKWLTRAAKKGDKLATQFLEMFEW